MTRERAWNADEDGLTPDDYREISWSIDQHFNSQRWKALRTLWGHPIRHRPRDVAKGWTVYDGYIRNRDEEWTFWRAMRASIAILINRYGEDYRTSRTLCFWDAYPVYGGYTVDCLSLSAGWRVSIFNDGETCL